MTETAEYGVCIAEGMLLLACLFGGLAIRAIWHKLLLTFPSEKGVTHGR